MILLCEAFPNKVDNPFIQIDLHTGIYWGPAMPIPVPGLYMFHVGVGSLATPLVGLGESKANGGKVLADSSMVVSRCHEPKHCILPHVNVLPFPFWSACNLLFPILTLVSSNKLEFASGSVVNSDGPLAVSRLIGMSLSCGEPISLPTGIPYNNGTVLIGFTLGDLVAGVLCIGFDILKGWIEGILLGKVGDRLGLKFPNLLKGQTLSSLRFMNRRFPFLKGLSLSPDDLASLTDDIAGDAVGDFFESLYSRLVGGDLGSLKVGNFEAPLPFLNDLLSLDYAPLKVIGGLITGDLITGYDPEEGHGLAGQIGQWIDSEAEPLPSGSGAMPIVMPRPTPVAPTATPTTATPTGTPTTTSPTPGPTQPPVVMPTPGPVPLPPTTTTPTPTPTTPTPTVPPDGTPKPGR